jgi:hypothetical protein
MKVHPFVEAERVADHSVNNACHLLEVSRSASYARTCTPPSQRAVTDAELLEQIRAIHPIPRAHMNHRESTRNSNTAG